jgi:monolysocardiolipin acyltransferase
MIPYKNLWNRTGRWSLGAKEICHSSRFTSWFFSLGQVMPVIRGEGIYQTAVNKAIEELNKGSWIHIFPEGRYHKTMLVKKLKPFFSIKVG